MHTAEQLAAGRPARVEDHASAATETVRRVVRHRIPRVASAADTIPEATHDRGQRPPPHNELVEPASIVCRHHPRAGDAAGRSGAAGNPAQRSCAISANHPRRHPAQRERVADRRRSAAGRAYVARRHRDGRHPAADTAAVAAGGTAQASARSQSAAVGRWRALARSVARTWSIT